MEILASESNKVQKDETVSLGDAPAKRKRGRPRNVVPKEKSTVVFLPEDKRILDDMANRYGRSRSDILHFALSVLAQVTPLAEETGFADVTSIKGETTRLVMQSLTGVANNTEVSINTPVASQPVLTKMVLIL